MCQAGTTSFHEYLPFILKIILSVRLWSFAQTLKALVDGETRRLNSERAGMGLVEDSLRGMHRSRYKAQQSKERKNKIQEKKILHKF